MLCGTRQKDHKKVFASQSQKDEGPFYCYGCGGELVLRKGRIKIHHFAHKPPYNCTIGEGETEAHRECKISIYNSLSNQPNVTQLELEKNLGDAVPDIYCFINGHPVAIEIQRSNISVDSITSRTIIYEKLGIYVVWLALFNDDLYQDKYSPKAWEKWCHATYFGRVYYWMSDLTVVPVHFSDYFLYVETSSWYNEYGEEQSAGGYQKTSKRYKTPQLGRKLNLATDFRPTVKPSWQGGSVYVPKCKIYCDKLRKWW